MANYNSIIAQYGEISPIDVDFMGKVLMAKQGQFDAGVAAVDESLAAMKQQENLLKRPEDKARFSANIQNILNTVNASGKLNFASKSITRDIKGQIGKALDDYTITQIGNSQIINNAYTEAAEKQKKGDPLFNNGNFNFAVNRAGFSDYLRGYNDKGEKVDSIGTYQYTNYRDLEKEASDFITSMEAKAGDDKIEYLDGQGGKQTVTRKNLNPNQIRQIAYSMLKGGAQEQLQINAWVNTGGYSDSKRILSNTESIVNDKITKNSDRILELQVENKTDISDKKKEQNNLELKQLEQEAINLKTNKTTLLSNIPLAATFLEQENFADTMTSKFGNLYKEYVSGYGIDDNYHKKIYEQRAEANYQLEADKFKYQKAKDTGGLQGTSSFITADIVTPTESSINQEDEIDSTIKTLNDNLDSVSTDYKNKLEDIAIKGTKSQRDQANVILNKYKSEVKLGKSEQEAFQTAVIQKADGNSEIIFGEDGEGNKINYLDRIRDISNRRDTYLLGRAEAIKKGTVEHIDSTINSKEGLKAFYNNPDTKMMWHSTSGKEGAYSVRDVLIASKIINNKGEKIGDIKKSPNLLKALQQSYYADAALSNNLSTTYISELAKTFNENPKDVVTTYKTVSTGSGSTMGAAGTAMTSSKINYNTKTGQFLLKAQKNGIQDTFSWGDNSLSGDDSTIGKYLSVDYKKSQTYINSINKLYGKLPQSQMVAVVPTDKTNFSRLGDIATSMASTTPIGELNKENPLNTRLDSTGQNIIISQYTTDKDKKTVSFEAIVPYKNFAQNAPENLLKQVDFASKQAHYTVDRVRSKDLISKNITFATSTENAEWLSQTVLANQPEFIQYLTKKDSRAFILTPIKNTFGEKSEELQIADAAIENAKDFNITGKIEKDFKGIYNLILSMRNSDGDIITSKKVSNTSEVDNFKRILDNAPQIYYTDMLRDIFMEQLQTKTATNKNAESYDKLIKNLK
jgi:hypothetical protein